jgi:hypothetical protein
MRTNVDALSNMSSWSNDPIQWRGLAKDPLVSNTRLQQSKGYEEILQGRGSALARTSETEERENVTGLITINTIVNSSWYSDQYIC